MSSLSRTTCHPVHSMPSHAREGLARELYAVHAQIFSGLDFEGFREYVLERPSWRTWIYVRHNPAGKLVGYTAIHAFLRDLQGRKSTIIRMEAGTLAEARGRDVTMIYGLLRLMRVWLRHPLRPVYMFAALTHPSSYTFLSRYVPGIWPHAERPEIPPHVMAQMEELSEAFGLERVEAGNPLIRRVNWVTIEGDEERNRWQSSTRRDTRFYVAQNPGYGEGHGLVTLLPLKITSLTRALARFVTLRAGRLWRLTVGGEQARPPTRAVPQPQPVRRPRPRMPSSEPPTMPQQL
jgi:hypothetical protein